MSLRKTIWALVAMLGLQAAHAQERGPVTNLPIPRFVSMKATEANVRRGPSLTHRIDWVYKHRDMPLEITAEFGHWRRVHDRDGAGGWVHFTLLSGVRTVVVTAKEVELKILPQPDAKAVAKLEQDVIARLGACDRTWCKLSVDGLRGWAPKSAVWGVRDDEIRK
ncbi:MULTISPECIES: SH3 domain-containing protein [Halocynthiibacter]|uniref:SH3 domain-containing protein n=1 Tax=Halocynthiibacter halioticoli TaxID=2986804 RepID=A0AAE3IX64_9RHOB|nr:MULTISPECIES: SH3 domain-containing protein [Halocynthiibacter]MCV6823644.1 SH3 domain-containing protein [Halocynthiibacter halioticoli]MCW4056645.1 SH3 domain-containing protein [Halocynthiibacter sp. SDUM655004]MDE0590338.1 SH3 domain-containing protein [Halocynthiibacter sp. C4]